MEIVTKSSCSECHAKMMCSAADMKIKEIVVPKPSDVEFTVGEEVNIVMKYSMGIKAVFISYLLPLAILLILLLSLLAIFKNELLIGLISIGAIAIYYFVIFLFRKRINRRFSFEIKKF